MLDVERAHNTSIWAEYAILVNQDAAAKLRA